MSLKTVSKVEKKEKFVQENLLFAYQFCMEEREHKIKFMFCNSMPDIRCHWLQVIFFLQGYFFAW